MRKHLLRLTGAVAFAAAMAASPAKAENLTITGAGATFPYPLYMKWADMYNGLTGMKMNYQSIGSGGGIQQIKSKTVDFGASDAPLTKEELDAAGLMQFPMIIGGVVPVLNVEGIRPGQLKLTGKVLAEIYLGKVAKWNDPAIAALNPDLRLPDLAITVVHRSDGSGTTWIFTNYLCKMSPEWKEKVGYKTSVKWPVGVGAKGNEGVAANVKNLTEGAIGYVEFAYALQTKMCHAQMQNQAGKFVEPSFETFSSAAAGADWKSAPGMYMVLTDQPGEKSWPITGASFILIYKEQPDAAKAEGLLKFFDWCYRSGGEAAKALYYVPIPAAVYGQVESRWHDDLASGGQKVWK
ncbi:MAG: phosphate ABC transporter substrate-binding protein PstS [Candidatus Brocadiia bacterium]